MHLEHTKVLNFTQTLGKPIGFWQTSLQEEHLLFSGSRRSLFNNLMASFSEDIFIFDLNTILRGSRQGRCQLRLHLGTAIRLKRAASYSAHLLLLLDLLSFSRRQQPMMMMIYFKLSLSIMLLCAVYFVVVCWCSPISLCLHSLCHHRQTAVDLKLHRISSTLTLDHNHSCFGICSIHYLGDMSSSWSTKLLVILQASLDAVQIDANPNFELLTNWEFQIVQQRSQLGITTTTIYK